MPRLPQGPPLGPTSATLTAAPPPPPVPPEVEPSSQDVRQALGRPVLLRCSLLRGSPQRIASAVWRFKGQLLPPPPAANPVAGEASDHSELRLDAVTRDSSGSYECSVSNDVGSAVCLFQVSGERPAGPAPPALPAPPRVPAASPPPGTSPGPRLSKTRPCRPRPRPPPPTGLPPAHAHPWAGPSLSDPAHACWEPRLSQLSAGLGP